MKYEFPLGYLEILKHRKHRQTRQMHWEKANKSCLASVEQEVE